MTPTVKHYNYELPAAQWRTEGGVGVFKPTPKFRRPSKIVPHSTRFVKTVKNC